TLDVVVCKFCAGGIRWLRQSCCGCYSNTINGLTDGRSTLALLSPTNNSRVIWHQVSALFETRLLIFMERSGSGESASRAVRLPAYLRELLFQILQLFGRNSKKWTLI